MSAVLVIDRRKGEGVYFKGNAKCKMQKCKMKGHFVPNNPL